MPNLITHPRLSLAEDSIEHAVCYQKIRLTNNHTDITNNNDSVNNINNCIRNYNRTTNISLQINRVNNQSRDNNSFVNNFLKILTLTGGAITIGCACFYLNSLSIKESILTNETTTKFIDNSNPEQTAALVVGGFSSIVCGIGYSLLKYRRS